MRRRRRCDDTEPGEQDQDEDEAVQGNKYLANISDKLTAAAAAAKDAAAPVGSQQH